MENFSTSEIIVNSSKNLQELKLTAQSYTGKNSSDLSVQEKASGFLIYQVGLLVKNWQVWVLNVFS